MSVRLAALAAAAAASPTIFNPYYDNSEDYSWDAANALCQSRGQQLVSIHNQEDLDVVAAYSSQFGSRFWIGGFWNGNAWAWSDGTAWDYNSMWNAGEPNGNANEPCMEMLDSGVANDLACGVGANHGLLCNGVREGVPTSCDGVEGDCFVIRMVTGNDGNNVGFGVYVDVNEGEARFDLAREDNQEAFQVGSDDSFALSGYTADSIYALSVGIDHDDGWVLATVYLDGELVGNDYNFSSAGEIELLDVKVCNCANGAGQEGNDCSSQGANECASCDDGFYLANEACYSCSEFGDECSLCDDSGCAAEGCDVGNFIDGANCSSCASIDPLCGACDVNGCSACAEGSFNDGNACQLCAEQEFCELHEAFCIAEDAFDDHDHGAHDHDEEEHEQAEMAGNTLACASAVSGYEVNDEGVAVEKSSARATIAGVEQDSFTLIAVAVVGAVIVLCVIGIIVIGCCNRKKKNNVDLNEGEDAGDVEIA